MFVFDNNFTAHTNTFKFAHGSLSVAARLYNKKKEYEIKQIININESQTQPLHWQI